MSLFRLNKLKFPSPKDAFGRFECKRPIGSEEENFLDFVNLFLLLSPFRKRCGPSTNLILFTEGCFVPSLVEIDNWFRKSRFKIKKSSVYFCYYLPLKKILITQECYVPSSYETG